MRRKRKPRIIFGRTYQGNHKFVVLFVLYECLYAGAFSDSCSDFRLLYLVVLLSDLAPSRSQCHFLAHLRSPRNHPHSFMITSVPNSLASVLRCASVWDSSSMTSFYSSSLALVIRTTAFLISGNKRPSLLIDESTSTGKYFLGRFTATSGPWLKVTWPYGWHFLYIILGHLIQLHFSTFWDILWNILSEHFGTLSEHFRSFVAKIMFY